MLLLSTFIKEYLNKSSLYFQRSTELLLYKISQEPVPTSQVYSAFMLVLLMTESYRIPTWDILQLHNIHIQCKKNYFCVYNNGVVA